MVWYACCAAEEKKNQHAVTEILDNCTWINIHTLPVRTLPISSSPSHSLTIIFTIASSHYHLHHHILGLPLSPSHYHSSSHSIIILTLSPMSSSQSLLAKLFCGIDKTNRVYVFTITIVQCTLMLYCSTDYYIHMSKIFLLACSCTLCTSSPTHVLYTSPAHICKNCWLHVYVSC